MTQDHEHSDPVIMTELCLFELSLTNKQQQ